MIQRVVVALVLLVACSGGTSGTTAPIRTPSLPTTSSGTTPAGLPGFSTATIGVGGDAWRVAVADTPALRRQGLMGVTDLGGLDGMLFVFESDTTGRFWMKDTLIPLDIAFFTVDGALVGDVIAMTPCGDADPCPTYGPGAPYRFAVETEAGGFDGVELTLEP